MPFDPATDQDRSAAVVAALRQTLIDQGHASRAVPLEPLPDKGLAHDHVRLSGTGWLARLPKQSQMGLDATDNLAYQCACFERAAPSGHTPVLRGVLAPGAVLPRGGLLVDEVVGRPARLPDDLPAIAQALAALHALPLPARAAPLRHAPDPLRDLQAEISAQAVHLPAAGLAPAARAAIDTERRDLAAAVSRPARPGRCLIAFDAHPGNFLVRADGRAVLVDLEKCRYAAPGLDLAHATLYTSTTWDVDTRAELTTAQEADFYRAWSAAVGPGMAVAARPWHLPLRRAMWLWSVTWCAQWRVLSPRPRRTGAGGQDWSSASSDHALVAHVRERVDHYLDTHTIERVRAGFDALQRELGP